MGVNPRGTLTKPEVQNPTWRALHYKCEAYMTISASLCLTNAVSNTKHIFVDSSSLKSYKSYHVNGSQKGNRKYLPCLTGFLPNTFQQALKKVGDFTLRVLVLTSSGGGTGGHVPLPLLTSRWKDYFEHMDNLPNYLNFPWLVSWPKWLMLFSSVVFFV